MSFCQYRDFHMSRAFVKEQDVEAFEDLPDRQISELPNEVTIEGVAQITSFDRRKRFFTWPMRPAQPTEVQAARVAQGSDRCVDEPDGCSGGELRGSNERLRDRDDCPSVIRAAANTHDPHQQVGNAGWMPKPD